MKKLIPLLAALNLLAQNVDTNTYPYPRPMPTNGTATPSTTSRRTTPFSPTLYNGTPIVWDNFFGGGYRIVSNATERVTIPMIRRKEGMQVFEASTTNIYCLDRSLTNWILLGTVQTNGFSAINIYNSDGFLRGNRKMIGNGFNLILGDTIDLGGFYVHTSAGDNTTGLQSIPGQVGFTSTTTGGNIAGIGASTNGLTLQATGTNQIYFKTPGVSSNLIPAGYILGLANTNGVVEFIPPSGVNFANADLTLLTNRLHDAAGYDLSITNIGILQLTSTGAGIYVKTTSADIPVEISSLGGATTIFAKDELTLTGANGNSSERIGASGIILTVATNRALYLQTPYQRMGLATNGQVLTMIDQATGKTEYATITGGTNIFTITGTNIYNADGMLTRDRTVDGGGNQLQFTDLSVFGVAATNVNINGSSLVSINSGAGADSWIFGHTSAGGNTNSPVVVRNPLTGVFQYTATTLGDLLSMGGGGNNFANTDLSLTSNRHQSGAGFNFNFDGVSTMTLSADNLVLHSGTSFKLQSPNVVNMTAVSGDVLTYSSESGTADFTTPLAPSPDLNDVYTVPTLQDLISESHNVVMTRGYYTAGDGGSAFYRYVSGDATATNTVTVFEGASGRYFLVSFGTITAKQAGAVGDGVANDHNALQNLLNSCVNLTARIEPLSYRVVHTLVLPNYVHVVATGATITVETTGEECGIDGSSWLDWDGGTIVDAYQSGGTSTNDHCPFRFGDWKGVANHGASNSILHNVTLDVTGNYNAASVFISQNSHNINIYNVEIPSSSTLGDAFVIHWGWVTFPTEAAGTRHPYNIRVKNVNVGAMTTSGGDGLAIGSSASYDISYENINVTQCRQVIEDTTGDFGFRYSGLTQLAMGSVSFKNVTCLYVHNYGAFIKSQNTFDTNRFTLNHTIENCTLVGANAGAGQAGLWMDSARNVTIRNTVIAGHEVGTLFTNGCSNITFDQCTFATNRLGGFVGSDPNTSAVTVRGCRVQNNSWGLSGTNAAGIRLLAGSNFRIVDNDIGNPSAAEANQEVGIQCILPFSSATIVNNNVINVKSGGINVAYHFGSAANSNTHLYLVSGNQTLSTISLMVGPDNIPYATRRKYRVFTGNGTPTLGTYIKGDRITIDEATATPFEKVCTSSGSPGSWITSY